MYVVPADGADRHYDVDGSIERSVGSFQQWLSGQTNGRTLRIDTYQDRPDITFFRTQRTDVSISSSLDVPAQINAELIAAGFSDPKKLYLVVYDGGGNVGYCGQAPQPPKGNGSVAVLFLQGKPAGAAPCSANSFTMSVATPGYFEFAMLHETLHGLGFVASCAPDHTTAAPGHVGNDPRDLMYAGPMPWRPSILDVNRRNYYMANNSGCLDLANSAFLTGGAATAEVPPGWPYGNQNAQACVANPPVSVGGGATTTVEFVNASSKPVQLFWIDFSGKRQQYSVIDPDGGYFQSTFGGHTWIATDSQGNCLSMFQIGAGSGFSRAVIKNPAEPSTSSAALTDPWTFSIGAAPGDWVSIFGTGLAASTESWNPSPGQPLPKTLGGTQVLINGQPAVLAYVSPSQVSVLIPGSITADTVQVSVVSAGGASASVALRNAPAHPAIYALPVAGAEPLQFEITAALAGSSTLIGNPSADPRVQRGAHPGESIDFYVTGLGATADLSLFLTDVSFSEAAPVALPVTLIFAGTPVKAAFAGLISPGLYLVRAVVPQSLLAGDAEVILQAGTEQSRSNVRLLITP